MTRSQSESISARGFGSIDMIVVFRFPVRIA